MKSSGPSNRLRLLGATLVLVALAVSPPSGAGELGELDFPTSAGPEAQKEFVEGVLYLHSFEYDDARDSFRRAQQAERGFALAYWGEALTYHHPVWLRENRDAAREALQRLAATPEERRNLAPTEREKAYLGAVEILFGDGEKLERDRAYAAAMKRLMEAYPEDLEAASLYAVSLFGTCHEGRDPAVYMRVAAVVEEVFARNPRHPGAAHYLIHAYDDPVHAPLGLRPARIYADIAPAAEHALHMPSHIFLALGLWPETVASNIDSWNAAEARMKRRGQSVERRGYHALYWMHYAYLQLGDLAAATERLEVARQDSEKEGLLRSRSHYLQMRAHQIVATRGKGTVPPSPSTEGLSLSLVAMDLFANGFAALRQGKPGVTRKALGEIRDRLRAEESEASTGPDAAGFQSSRPRGERGVEVLALELEALLELEGGDVEDGKVEAALATLRKAVALEEGMSFGFGPPSPVKPSSELLGEVLLRLERFEEAEDAFEVALARYPGRALSVEGLEAARKGG